MKTTIVLTPEKFQEIYKDEKFRNAVAYAHACADAQGRHKHFLALMYPIDYIVTSEQITIAQKEVERAKKEALKNLGNKLVFVGMGMTYSPRYEGDVCNHRIRTEFQNPSGRRFFIELGTGKSGTELMRCDHAIDRTRQDELNDHPEHQGEFYNYLGLERNQWPKYSLSAILKLVNENFECKFTEIEIDNFTLSPDEFICKSPK